MRACRISFVSERYGRGCETGSLGITASTSITKDCRYPRLHTTVESEIKQNRGVRLFCAEFWKKSEAFARRCKIWRAQRRLMSSARHVRNKFMSLEVLEPIVADKTLAWVSHGFVSWSCCGAARAFLSPSLPCCRGIRDGIPRRRWARCASGRAPRWPRQVPE